MSALYQASHIKRVRATGAELDRRRVALYTIVSEMEPMTVRQVFYQATVRNIVDKTEFELQQGPDRPGVDAARRLDALRLDYRSHPLPA